MRTGWIPNLFFAILALLLISQSQLLVALFVSVVATAYTLWALRVACTLKYRNFEVTITPGAFFMCMITCGFWVFGKVVYEYYSPTLGIRRALRQARQAYPKRVIVMVKDERIEPSQY